MRTLAYNDASADRNVVAIVQAMRRSSTAPPKANPAASSRSTLRAVDCLAWPGRAEPAVLYAGRVDTLECGALTPLCFFFFSHRNRAQKNKSGVKAPHSKGSIPTMLTHSETAMHHPQETTSNADRDLAARFEPKSLRTYTPSQAVLASSAAVHWTPEVGVCSIFRRGAGANLGHNPRRWMQHFVTTMGWAVALAVPAGNDSRGLLRGCHADGLQTGDRGRGAGKPAAVRAAAIAARRQALQQ